MQTDPLLDQSEAFTHAVLTLVDKYCLPKQEAIDVACQAYCRASEQIITKNKIKRLCQET